jgi:hypothetical protein
MLLQISFDLFVCGTVFTDLATVSALANITGGQVLHFPGFQKKPSHDAPHAAEDDMLRSEAMDSLCSNVSHAVPARAAAVDVPSL